MRIALNADVGQVYQLRITAVFVDCVDELLGINETDPPVVQGDYRVRAGRDVITEDKLDGDLGQFQEVRRGALLGPDLVTSH